MQNLRAAVAARLRGLMARNPLRVDLQRRYEEIVAKYNGEKEQLRLEEYFEELVGLVARMSEEEGRTARVGLDEEALAVLLRGRRDLTARAEARVKGAAVCVLRRLKAGALTADRWRDKGETRARVRAVIVDFLWDEEEGLPAGVYSEAEVAGCAEEVFRHVMRVYPRLPSPVFERGLGERR